MSRGRALVAGAGGFLGRSIVAALHQRGWEVRGLVPREAGAPVVAQAGGVPVVASVLEAPRVREACRGCELVFHVAASDSSGAEGEARARRTRVDGARVLAGAASTEGVHRLVLGSGYWVYADSPKTISESSPLDPRGESGINWEAERAALEEAGSGSTEVLVVRPGMVYGPGSWLAGIVRGLREGSYRYIDEGRNPWSFVSQEDAGRGFVQVAERGRAGEVYNLVDGAPVPWRVFGDRVSELMGIPPAGSMDRKTAEGQYGPEVAHHLSARRACTAEKIRSLGWTPIHANYEVGLQPLQGWLQSSALPGSVR